jgi:hypothetical protein
MVTVLIGVMLTLPFGLLGQVATSREAAAAPAPPPYVLSNYVESLNYSQWNSWGCAQAEYSAGQHVSSISLVLDFGNAIDSSGRYGTSLANTSTFAQWDSGTSSGIRFLIASFLTGYWNCHSTGTYGTAPFITLIVGIASSNTNGLADPTNADWMAEVIAAMNSWISGSGLGGVEYVEGGMDIEMEYAAYSKVVAYEKIVLAGYCNDVGQCSGPIPVNDFGEANCSESSYNANSACGSYGWTQGEVLDVSYGEAYASPLPLIFNSVGANATQWYWISKGSIQTGYGPLYFDAEMTQHTACSQVGVGNCSGTDNLPGTGWTQLYNAIYNDVNTRPGVTGGWLQHSDDIRYLPYPY